jgi:hypothetical protein
METDEEKVVTDWLQGKFPDAFCCTETPADMASVLPVIRVLSLGGPNTKLAMGRPAVSIACYHVDRVSAKTLAKQIFQAMRFEMPGYQPGMGTTVNRVNTISGPAWRPYDNTNLRCFGMTLQLVIHTTYAAT